MRRKVSERRLGAGTLIEYDQGWSWSGDTLDVPIELGLEIDRTPEERARLFDELVRRREAAHRSLGFVDPVRGVVKSFDSFEEYERWLDRRSRELAARGERVIV